MQVCQANPNLLKCSGKVCLCDLSTQMWFFSQHVSMLWLKSLRKPWTWASDRSGMEACAVATSCDKLLQNVDPVVVKAAVKRMRLNHEAWESYISRCVGQEWRLASTFWFGRTHCEAKRIIYQCIIVAPTSIVGMINNHYQKSLINDTDRSRLVDVNWWKHVLDCMGRWHASSGGRLFNHTILILHSGRQYWWMIRR